MVAFEASRVLVPTDFSEQSVAAVDLALSMVARPEQVTVLHVAPSSSYFVVGDPALDWQTVNEDTRVEHLQKMMGSRFNDKKYLDVQFEVVFGAPAEEIANYAEKDQAELIVLPSHGRTGLARLMIGSVAERVVRLAHCPVLVLRN